MAQPVRRHHAGRTLRSIGSRGTGGLGAQPARRIVRAAGICPQPAAPYPPTGDGGRHHRDGTDRGGAEGGAFRPPPLRGVRGAAARAGGGPVR